MSAVETAGSKGGRGKVTVGLLAGLAASRACPLQGMIGGSQTIRGRYLVYAPQNIFHTRQLGQCGDIVRH